MKRIFITSGDPSGIGPEIILKLFTAAVNSGESTAAALSELLQKREIVLLIAGPLHFYELLIKKFNLPVKILKRNSNNIKILSKVVPRVEAEFIDVPYHKSADFSYGAVIPASGENALAVLEKSVNYLKLDLADAVVTAPVNKEAIAIKKKGFIGHTEFYASNFAVDDFSMCFLSSFFNLVLLTTHIPVAEVHSYITAANIKKAVKHACCIKEKEQDPLPIAFMGLNPHAGENGMFGTCDGLIGQTLKELQQQGMPVQGPLPADSAFQKVYQGQFNTVISCYHDQGLIPLKMLAKGGSVNITLGLPFIRTSVDHGTAYDIAGTFQAGYGSLVNAVIKAYHYS
ncbi:MAG TPA: 4-hydroxythreonine-4-phosphate dehydrogenase PdxA [Spirochaetota bacterium]|nr:4-hydroxythreonine-4-phosphate dehydrogenase PdxA [Spirochaetota bacterium]